MKSIITLALSTCVLFSCAQINLEHEFSQAEMLNQYAPSFIHLTDNDVKYVSVSSVLNTIQFYELDYSVGLTIEVPASGNYNIRYISKTLFDCDSSNIEYMITYWPDLNTEYGGKIQVFRQDGTLLFERDNANLLGAGSAGWESNINRFPIVSTPEGTKMFITAGFFGTDGCEVYSLCGALPLLGCGTDSLVGIADTESGMIHYSLAFPNPASSIVKLNYEWPQGAESLSISLYDAIGHFIKSFLIERHQPLQIEIADLSVGLYTYVLQASKQMPVSGQIVKQ